jgi:hypothetical protein
MSLVQDEDELCLNMLINTSKTKHKHRVADSQQEVSSRETLLKKKLHQLQIDIMSTSSVLSNFEDFLIFLDQRTSHLVLDFEKQRLGKMD